MRYSIISKVRNKYPYIEENVCGMAFIQKACGFYEAIGKINNSNAGLMLLKTIALGLRVNWNMVVQYIYYLVKEKTPSLYKDYEHSLDYQYVCLNIGGVFTKLLTSKGDSVYANKFLFDAVVANTDADAEEWLQKFILEKYGWDNVMVDLVMMYNQYMSENAQIAEKEDYDYIIRIIKAINKKAKEDKAYKVSVAIKDALTKEEYIALINMVIEDENAAHKLHLKVVGDKIYSEEEVEDEVPILEEEPKVNEETVVEELIDAAIVSDEENKNAVISTDEKGNRQKFNSTKEASLALGINVKYINKILRGDSNVTGKKKSDKHYTFEWVIPHNKKGKILQIDPHTNEVVEVFRYASEAERKYGYKKQKINGVLKTKGRLFDGYLWMWESEYKEKFPSIVYKNAS